MIRLLSIVVSTVILTGCNDKKEFSTDFFIRNSSSAEVEFLSFFQGEINRQSTIAVNSLSESYGPGGPPVYDSAIFIRKSDMDSIIYRNAKFGEDVSTPNHFFDADNWIEAGEDYFYQLTDEDFD